MPPDKGDFPELLLKHGYSGMKKLGEGSFGMAVLVEDGEGAKCVCKMVKVGESSMRELLEARKEGRLLAHLQHPYIVRYRTSFLEGGWLCIVMDYCEGGTLADKIQRAAKGSSTIAEAQVVRWVTQAVLALQYLHSKAVLHRDLKPGNLFLTKRDDLVMGDFGLSKVLDCTMACAKTLVGTPYYLSPEVIQDQPYSWPCDIWAMGCILFELCALKVPFESASLPKLAQKICFSKLPRLPSGYSAELQELCTHMMSRNPDERPCADEIIKRPLIEAVAQKVLSEAQDLQQERPKAQQVIIDQFRKFDLNGDGVIDREELSRVLTHLDSALWTRENIDKFVSTVDVNRDGNIQLDEFVAWVFGGGEKQKTSLVERCQQNMESAQVDMFEKNVSSLEQSLLQWRQAVVIGCFTILPPNAVVENCETLASLAVSLHEHMQGKAGKDKTLLSDCFHAIKQMREILHGVEQLLSDYSKQRVRRVVGIVLRSILHGFCIELTDGTRLGQCPAGLSDGGLAAANWESLADGEQIVEVKGFGAAPASPRSPGSESSLSPKAPGKRFTLGSRAKSKGKIHPPGRRRAETPTEDRPDSSMGGSANSASDMRCDAGLAASLVLCTSRGREIQFGSSASSSRGPAFSYKAPVGEEIEEIQFGSNTCVGVKSSPVAALAVTWDFWDKRKFDKVQSAFRLANDAVCSTLLTWSWSISPSQGKYALLQARRLGLRSLFVPEEIQEKQKANSMSMTAPAFWDLSVMKLGQGNSMGVVPIGPSTIDSLKLLLADSFSGATRSESSTSALPSGLELVRGFRLQSWQGWADFVARQEEVCSDLRKLSSDGIAANINVPGLKTAGHLKTTSLPSDAEANCAWLFHSLSVEAAKNVAATDFGIDRTGVDAGRYYGRGIYLSECCRRADELASAPNAEGLRCMLLCRTILGHMLYDDALLPDIVRVVDQCVDGPFHSVLGDREKGRPGSHREFVVYNLDQVYPEYLLWYKRVYS